MPNTLYDHYNAQGKPLPAAADRFNDPAFAAAATKAGVTKEAYLAAGANNADFNNRIVAALGATDQPGNISGKLPAEGAATTEAPVGDLSNLRLALRNALNEGAQKRSASNFTALSKTGAVGVPGSIASVVDLIKGSAQSDATTIFDDVITTLDKERELKAKQADQINTLRAQYGSLIPAGVTDISKALDLIAPAVDKENKLKIAKLQKDLNGGDGGGVFNGISLSSPSTMSVLNGMSSISTLTPTEQGKVRADLTKMGFGDETPPQWYTKQLSEQTMSSNTPGLVQQKWSELRSKVLFGTSSIDESFFSRIYGPEEGLKIWDESKGVISAYHDAGFDDPSILKLMQEK